jgi:nucleoside transporter
MRFVRTRLSINFFLEFATWGAWLPILGNHLTQIGFTSQQIGLVIGVGSLAGMIGPLVAGQIADRWMATQYLLAICHFISSVFFFLAAAATGFWPVWTMTFLAMLFYMPTLGLSNALSLRHLKDNPEFFPVVRSFGTLGWISAGLLMSLWFSINPARPIGDCLRFGALCAFLQGVVSFFLPNTPPQPDSKKKFAVGEAIAMMRERSYAVFIVLSFLLMFVNFFYISYEGKFFQESLQVPMSRLSALLSVSQCVELLTLWILPFVHRKLGTKMTIALGMLTLALRFGVYVWGHPLGLVLAAKALNGVYFGFVFVVAMMYVDKVAPKDARASAQSFLSFITFGAGMFGASLVVSQVGKFCTLPDNSLDFRTLFMFPLVGAAIILVTFLIFFKPKKA